METELAKYRSFHGIVKLMMKVIGLWPSHASNRIVESTLNWTIIALGVVASLSVFSFSIHHRSNIPLLTSSMSFNVSFITMALKVAWLMSYRNCLLELNTILDKNYEENLKVSSYKASLLKRVAIFRGFFCTLLVLVGITTVSQLMIPIKRIIAYHKYTTFYPANYPIAFEPGGFIYWCIFLIEGATCFFLSMVSCAVEPAFGFYVFQICGLFRVLGLEIQKLSNDENYYTQLKECVKKHRVLMRCRDNLQQLFGFIAIYLCITASLVLCALVFQVSKMKRTNLGIIIKLVTYLLSKLLQTFTYACGGSLITIESEASLDAVYNCNWPGSGDKRLMNDVLIMLSQKPTSIKFKEFFVISLDLFKAVVSTTVSYFFLLDTLDS